MKKTRFIALTIAIAMLLSNFIFAYAIERPIEPFEKPTNVQNGEQIVPVIIETVGLSLLENPLVQSMGYKKFLSSLIAQAEKSKIMKSHSEIQNKIVSTIFKDAKFSYSYTNSLNGFSANIRVKDIDSVLSISGVKNVYLDAVYELPTPQMSTSNEMINTPDLWKVGIKGESTVVAVIDSGFDVDHELMTISESTKAKLETKDIEAVLSRLNANKLITGLKAANVYANKKFPYCFDYADKDIDPSANRSTHGVHVSGIIAANGTVAQQQNNQLLAPVIFDGVAPETQIVGMKVFSDFSDGAKTSDIMAAVEDAITIGVDAINLSLGSSAGFTLFKDIKKLKEYEYEVSFLRARLAGIIVSASAGNSNRIGLKNNWETKGYTYPLASNPDAGLVGSPSVKFHATSVASVENTHYYANIIEHISKKQMPFYDNGTKFASIFNKQTLDYVYCGVGGPQDFTKVNVQGKIALIQRGTYTFVEKTNNAIANGAKGVIIFNNKSGGDVLLNMANNAAKSPAISIGYNNGMFLANSTDTKIYIEEGLVGQYKNTLGYQMSDFTSWGCTPDLKLKPEITAPGGNIYSTINNNQYGSMSGTSMAAPHIAGASALLKQYVDKDIKYKLLPDMEKANIIEKLLMSTATILKDKYGDEYSPRRQGAGLINLESAINTNVFLTNLFSTKAKVELGDNIGDNFKIEFDAINLSTNSYKYEINSSIFTDYVADTKVTQFILPNIQSLEKATITASGKNVSNNVLSVKPLSINHVVINVSLDANEVASLSQFLTNGFFVEGFVKLLSLDDQPDLNIPYMGFYGKWNQAPIFDGSLRYDEKFPFYANSYAYDYAYDPNGTAYGYYSLGGNASAKIFNYNWIAFSPNNDKIYDNMGMRLNLLRNARSINVTIQNDKGQLVKELLNDTYYTKTYYYSNGGFLTTTDLPLWDGKDKNDILVENGQYYYTISAKIDENSNANYQTWKVPVYMDTTAPTIVSCSYSQADKKLTLSLNDNHLVTYIALTDGINVINEMPLDAPTTTLNNLSFDLSQFTKNTITLHIEDCAGNIIEQIIDLTVVN